MEIKVHDHGNVRVLALDGRLSLGGGAAAVHEDVRRELEDGHHQLVLAMAEVEVIDSTGLGVLVSCLTSARHRGGDLKLLQPSPRVGDILEITQANQLFEIFDDEHRAIQSFA